MIKCDRCGKKFPVIFAKKKELLNDTDKLILCFSDVQCKLDICPDCKKSFDEWLNVK